MDKTVKSDKINKSQFVQASRPVIFLHIPKTAGTTLHDIIERNYDPAAVCTFGSDAHAAVADFKNLSLNEREQVRLLRGHMAFGLHEYLPITDDYFTILRDPVDRVISYYNFILRTPDHYLYQIIQSSNMSLSDLLRSKLPLMMNDAQVRLLSGVWGDIAFGGVTDEMRQTAESNLREYFVVAGITEEFDKTLCLLREELNWGSNIQYERQNVSQRGLTQQQLPAGTIDLIRHSNKMDIALYTFAKGLFAQQAKQQGFWFPVKVKLFQARNQWEPVFRRLRTFSIRAFIKKDQRS